MRKNSFIFLFFFFLLHSQTSLSQCKKDGFFNPINEVNWENMYPLKLLSGITLNPTSNKDPSNMKMPPLCNCKGRLGAGITFWEPAHVIEVVRDYGCSPTIAATLLDKPEQKGIEMGSYKSRHVHWFQYPLFKIMNMFNNFSCLSNVSQFAVGYLSELDPTWMDPTMSLIVSPETKLFANIPMILACMPDVVASNLGKPINQLYWCAGSQGLIYPQVGKISTREGNANIALNFAHKTIAKVQTKLLSIGKTIGKNARCQAQFSQTIEKKQFRFNILRPKARTSGKAITWGQSVSFMGKSAVNSPSIGSENYSFLIWQAKQCCVSP